MVSRELSGQLLPNRAQLDEYQPGRSETEQLQLVRKRLPQIRSNRLRTYP